MRNVRSAVTQTFTPGATSLIDCIMTNDILVRGYQYRQVFYVNQLSGYCFNLGKFQVFKYTTAFTPNKKAPLDAMHEYSIQEFNRILEPTGWTIHNNEWKTI